MKDIQAVISALTIVLGVALLVYMVAVESEPGAIPLLLIAVGTGWLLVTRRRARAHSK